MATDLEVAQWMLTEFNKNKGRLEEATTMLAVERTFGPEFVCPNDAGGPVFSKPVLRAFRGLAPDAAWDASTRTWGRRVRRPSSLPPGR